MENENEENYEKETQITTNQDIPIIICESQPQVVLTRLKRKDYEKYIENDQQPLNFIEKTISSNVSMN